MALLDRIGIVVYIAAWIVGGPLIALMALGAVTGTLSAPDQWLAGVMGLAVLLTGRAIHFILSGH